MGYSTNFEGKLEIKPTLPKEAVEYIQKFNNTRRMKREFEGNIHGIDGEFYVDGGGFAGQDREPSIIDFNSPPLTQPSLWCGWTVSNERDYLNYDEREKFHRYIDWMKYMINAFFQSNGFMLNGVIEWQGEDLGDTGRISVQNNVITVYSGGVYESFEPKKCNLQKKITG